MPDMDREELEETVAAAICCHTRWSLAVEWEVETVMKAIDRYVEYLKNQEEKEEHSQHDASGP